MLNLLRESEAGVPAWSRRAGYEAVAPLRLPRRTFPCPTSPPIYGYEAVAPLRPRPVEDSEDVDFVLSTVMRPWPHCGIHD